MKISDNEKKVFINYIRELLVHEQVQEMNRYIQHGNTTTFTHSLAVAYYSYVFALRLPFHYDIKSIVRGAMLHDFYLYDWHIPDKTHKLHGFIHPSFALLNAKKYFSINQIEEEIIKKHMWPLTFSKIPGCREAMIVCFIDKICSTAETLYIPLMPKDYRRLHRMLSLRKLVY